MDIEKIIHDSLKYPLSDWKKFLILGIMLLIPALVGFATSFSEYSTDVWISIIFMFIIGLFLNGYLFRILKTSLDDLTELPEFKDWKEMFTDGVKVFSVVIVYTIPTILIIAYLLMTFYQIVVITGSTDYQASLLLNQYIFSLVNSQIGSMFVNYLFISYDLLISLPEGIYAIAGIFYIIIIIPLCLMGLGNMANYGEFSAAFRLREIFEDINYIGWINLIKWYIVIGFVFLVLFTIIPSFISYILFLNHLDVPIINLIWEVVIAFIVLVPYSNMFFTRAVALLYMSE